MTRTRHKEWRTANNRNIWCCTAGGSCIVRTAVNIATQQPSIYQVASNRLFHFPAGSYLNTYNYVISGAKRYISFLKLVGLKLDYYISVLYSKSVLTGFYGNATMANDSFLLSNPSCTRYTE